ncbi:DBIRD complex subunit ZNF326-like [Limanda limanda]|uniref:DBIRD complex subunit ZNF326-like n=1 Tax=Limanda limanda TaxID=27771 RepID=UPI0029C9A5A8|nr:DBIRD complex subunit ZNF326-like [Limanda limanda]
MNRHSHVPFGSSAAPPAAAPPPPKHKPGRIPKDFMEAMKRLPVKVADNSNIRPPSIEAAEPQPTKKRAGKPSGFKWKSSFTPLGGEEGEEEKEEEEKEEEEEYSPDKSTTNSEMVELYDPYEPGLSDSEFELAQSKAQHHSSLDQENNTESQRLSPGSGCRDKGRWDSPYPKPGNQLFDRPDLRHEFIPDEGTENESLGSRPLPEREAYSPHREPFDQQEYDSRSRPLDHRVRSPERIVARSSSQEFTASYRGQETNGEERMRMPEHRREMTTTVRLSPPKLRQNSRHHSGNMEKDLEPNMAAKERTRNRTKMVITDKDPITCDLCDVTLGNGQELEAHLDSRGHWDTLEYIQQNNNYDDLEIAFLQDVMLYKSRQCSRAIEQSAVFALQENDHMAKLEMFHCAACDVYVSTSASSVQTHITSMDHLSNIKEFEVHQRRTCLDKAVTIMNKLKPQFEHFVKGDNLF